MSKSGLSRKGTKLKVIAGWKEHVHFPDLDIWNLRAKIDTGARTSSLHVEDVHILPHNRVRFTVVLDAHKSDRNKTLIEKIHRTGKVRTNHQDVQTRIFIKTKMKLGPVEEEIEINLTNRSDLRFRLILGRKAVSGHFLVDPKKGDLL